MNDPGAVTLTFFTDKNATGIGGVMLEQGVSRIAMTSAEAVSVAEQILTRFGSSKKYPKSA